MTKAHPFSQPPKPAKAFTLTLLAGDAPRTERAVGRLP